MDDTAPLAAALYTLGKVRDLHGKPRTERHGSGCVHCAILWPCPTYRLVVAALDGEPNGDTP
jgi:hypothetical protein